MKRILLPLILLALAPFASVPQAIAQQAAPIGYLGIGLVYKGDKLVGANILGLAPTMVACLKAVQSATANFIAHGVPAGITANGACVPVPGAPTAAKQEGDSTIRYSQPCPWSPFPGHGPCQIQTSLVRIGFWR